MDALGLGLALGLAASISPGPLLVLVVTSALRSGRRAGTLTACAPLLSDAVVVAVTLLLLDRLPARALGVLGVVGAALVVWSGVQTVREARSASLRAGTAPTPGPPLSGPPLPGRPLPGRPLPGPPPSGPPLPGPPPDAGPESSALEPSAPESSAPESSALESSDDDPAALNGPAAPNNDPAVPNNGLAALNDELAALNDEPVVLDDETAASKDALAALNDEPVASAGAVSLARLDSLGVRELRAESDVAAERDSSAGPESVAEGHASQPSPPRGSLVSNLPVGSDNSGAVAFRRAVLVNIVSPNPWIAWATALGPLAITTWRESAGAGAALLIGFYLTLVGGKVVIALLVARGRRRLGDTGYRRALTGAGVLLVLVGVVMGVEFATYGM